MSKIAVYPGTFDPITLGHIDVIKRALHVFDKIIVLIAENPNKKNLFSIQERKELAKKSLSNLKGIEIDSWENLTVDYLKKNNLTTLIRGLREISDFQSEFQQATLNRKLYSKTDTFFVMTNAKYFYLSSSAVKEIASLKGDLSCFVPKPVEKALIKKLF